MSAAFWIFAVLAVLIVASTIPGYLRYRRVALKPIKVVLSSGVGNSRTPLTQVYVDREPDKWGVDPLRVGGGFRAGYDDTTTEEQARFLDFLNGGAA